MPQIKIIKEDILSDNWYVLKNFTIEQTSEMGISKTYKREAYDRGNGATILLHNKDRRTVILTRQFRLPTYINGNASGMLIETCAGLLDLDNPEDAIKRETEEETGYKLSSVEKVFEVYMSPGSVTEKLYFFIAEYTPDMKESDGGGIDDEEIEVLEILFEEAMAMIRSGEIQDGKTIMLLQHLALSAML
ncbi:MAG TPA: GDP-mannose pyrophosphatase NudK [Mucilaginibacter sp.]